MNTIEKTTATTVHILLKIKWVRVCQVARLRMHALYSRLHLLPVWCVWFEYTSSNSTE